MMCWFGMFETEILQDGDTGTRYPTNIDWPKPFHPQRHTRPQISITDSKHPSSHVHKYTTNHAWLESIDYLRNLHIYLLSLRYACLYRYIIVMEDFDSATDSDYTSYWRDWVRAVSTYRWSD